MPHYIIVMQDYEMIILSFTYHPHQHHGTLHNASTSILLLQCTILVFNWSN